MRSHKSVFGTQAVSIYLACINVVYGLHPFFLSPTILVYMTHKLIALLVATQPGPLPPAHPSLQITASLYP